MISFHQACDRASHQASGVAITSVSSVVIVASSMVRRTGGQM